MATIAENLKSIADSKAAIKTAIIAKGVAVADSDALSTYAGKINDISSGGGADGQDFADFLAGTATYINSSYATSVSDTRCQNYSTITTMSLPRVTVAGTSSFRGCTGLKSFSMDALQTVGNYSFYGCTALEKVSLPAVVTIGSMAFYGCTAMGTVDIGDKITSISGNSFGNCAAITSITVNRSSKAVLYSPWGAPSTATISWTGTA